MIGILALQGCVDPHIRMYARMGVDAIRVTTEEDLKKIDKLIIPGGESSTMLKLLDRNNLFEPLSQFVKTKPVWGVCAGAILLAKKVSHPEQKSLSAADIHAVRNFYGSQLDSFSTTLSLSPAGISSLKVDFIRAPKLEPLSDKVSVLGTHEGTHVLMRQGSVLVSSFHPELGEDPALHRYFLEMGET